MRVSSSGRYSERRTAKISPSAVVMEPNWLSAILMADSYFQYRPSPTALSRSADS